MLFFYVVKSPNERLFVMTYALRNMVNKAYRFYFIVGQTNLECVNSYKYLGVEISANGKFLTAEKNLSLKASRALFSIKQSILIIL